MNFEIMKQVEINSYKASDKEIPELEASGSNLKPLILLLETYKALTKLNQLFQSKIDSEYVEARTLLLKLRRDLQKRINNSLKQTNITSFLTTD